jgi:hypothetical protein
MYNLINGKNMNTKCIKKGIALVALAMICSTATARPHHHFRHAMKAKATVVVVKKSPLVVVKQKTVMVKKVIIVRK